MNEPNHKRKESVALTGQPLYSFSREAIQGVDRAAVEEFHIPGLVLMENAARSAAEEILCLEAERDDPEAPGRSRPVLILCGKGNNGGDGFAMARHLHNEGFRVGIALAFDPDDESAGTDEVRTHLRIARSLDLSMTRIDDDRPTDSLDHALRTLQQSVGGGQQDQKSAGIVLVDALLGTGLTSPPRAPFDRIIHWINQRHHDPDTTVVAVDVPSGLDCDTGRPLGDEAVRAHLTVTFVGLKKGFLEPEAQPFVGDLAIGDIGAPIDLMHRLGHVVTADEVFDT